MKKILKTLFLGALTIGFVAGCDKVKEKIEDNPEIIEKILSSYSI